MMLLVQELGKWLMSVTFKLKSIYIHLSVIKWLKWKYEVHRVHLWYQHTSFDLHSTSPKFSVCLLFSGWIWCVLLNSLTLCSWVRDLRICYHTRTAQGNQPLIIFFLQLSSFSPVDQSNTIPFNSLHSHFICSLLFAWWCLILLMDI